MVPAEVCITHTPASRDLPLGRIRRAPKRRKPQREEAPCRGLFFDHLSLHVEYGRLITDAGFERGHGMRALNVPLAEQML